MVTALLAVTIALNLTLRLVTATFILAKSFSAFVLAVLKSFTVLVIPITSLSVLRKLALISFILLLAFSNSFAILFVPTLSTFCSELVN